ncbi:filamentous hemagglutinin family N-terminal domain-containing protein [Polaromonas sp. YR568]|uniref:two-partner secretion domain-containing protein n=1 Tax=Polaromonas sp. YR568 TaxID=1855301 RepID=UPI0008EBF02C|nr:hemagglutinin repeat-containing protein [Polaromonas sp. YR568]SFU47539.1 filamentous hemagglutinin family N-terminal domain-containing protein [Polaromonas sp. YR568]
MHKHATANRSFRLVWSAARGAYVVAPETASGRSKSSASSSVSGNGQAGRLATAAALAFGVAWCGGAGFDAMAQVLPAPTTVVPAGGNTKAYTNPNGVPVVNIATANAAGLSNNLYTKYNVDANGLVLNNIANASGGRSYLAGQVQGNLNLNAPAQVILNQVVSPNRSSLAGFTEVLGNKADVIVANPYGITCSGCGFINTDRVTLTTGLPTIAADGSLTGFSVTGGDILVNGTGLNASAQQILDLVTRSVRLEGQVNAASTGSIGITTGNNQWNYGSRTVTGSTTGSGAAPAFAVDSTALGGMYAGRIQLIATEAGVGVRMLGEVAASTDDFTLSSAGKIDVRSKVAAKRDLSVTTTSAGADAIKLTDAQLSATRNLQMQSATGGATINGGVLVAGGSLDLSLATLSDIQSGTAITDNNKRFGDTVNITTTGATSLDGVSWGAAKALNANMSSLNVGASGGTLSGGTTTTLATAGDMNLGKATVWSSGDMSLTAATGSIRTAAGGQGVESKTGKLDISAGNGLDNDGAIAASNGAMTVKVNGTLDNAGTLYSKSVMTISDKAGATTENIINSGTLLADGTLNIKAAQVTNSGDLQGTGGTTLTANSLNNSGKFIASSAAGTSATLNLATLSNSGAGTVQANQDLALNVSSALTNAGNVIAGRNLGITSAGSSLTLTNQSGGTLQAGATTGSTLSVAGPAVTLNNNAGAKMLGDTFNVAAATINNDGTLQGGRGASTLAVAGTLTNTGTVNLATNAAGSGVISANQIANSGTLQSTGAATLSTATSLNNTVTGKIMANQLAVTAADLGNAGVLQGGSGASTVNVTNTLTNSGTLTLATTGAGSGTINANQITNSGTLQSTGSATLSTATSLNNTVTGKIMANQLAVTAADLANAGVLQGGAGASTFNVANTVNNSGTLTLATTAAGSGTMTANQITNSGTLQSTSSAALNVATGVSNTAAGKILAGTSLTVRGTDAAYAVDNQGLMQSGGLLDVKGQGGSNGVTIGIGGSGKILGQTVALTTQDLTIADGGSLGSTNDMTVAASSLTLGGTTAKIVGSTAGGNTTILAGNNFSNPGAIHSGGNLIFNAASLNNTNTGGISALGDLNVTATAGDISNSGALYAGSTLTATAAGHTITNVGTISGQTGTMDSGGNMNLTAGAFVNNSVVRAGGAMTIDAATFKNEVAGGDTRSWVEVSRTTPTTYYQRDEWYSFPDTYVNEYWKETWRLEQQYANNTAPTFTPQLIGGNSITIRNFTSGKNLGSSISAPTVTLIGTGSFTNDSLSLGYQEWQKTWDIYSHCAALSCYQATAYEWQVKKNESGDQLVTPGVLSARAGGIYASNAATLSGFGLSTSGPQFGAAPVAKSASAATGSALASTSTPAGTTAAVINVSPVGSASAVTFGGIVIQLPTNPNGYFVMTPGGSATYLVETNPLFATVTNLYGSSYLADQFGMNPDQLTKRLGDANYEAYLIRQQLVAQTGQNLLAGYQKESDLLQAMMTNGALEAKSLGFAWGEAPGNDKLAQLTHDVVWMVKINVAGQDVLTPVVYLSASTIASLQGGTMIAARSITMSNMDSVANKGGAIVATDSLSITAKNDISNESGSIKGGSVSLTSTGGSIINKTLTSTGTAVTVGGMATTDTGCADSAKFCQTTVGNTAGIEATSGNLSLNAGKNIEVIGANLAAKGDASLEAGGGITFDTIKDVTRTSAFGSERTGLSSMHWEQTSTTTTNTGSSLVTGGNLTLNSKGGDTALYSATVDVGGNLNATSSGNLIIGTREDETKTKTTLTTSLVAGQDLSADAYARIAAVMPVRDPAPNAGPTTRDYSQESYSSTKQMGTQGEANVAFADNRDINRAQGTIFSQTTTTVDDVNKTSVASKITARGNLNLTAANNTITVQGSDVHADGNVALNAKNVEVLAAKNEHTVTTTNTSLSIGVFVDGKSVSSVEAGASRIYTEPDGPGENGAPLASAKADAIARTENDGAMTIGQRTENKTTVDKTIVNTASRISSGGNLSVTAAETAKFVGSQMTAGQDLSITAKDITNEAAKDEKSLTTTWSQETQGLSLEGRSDSQAYARARVTGVTGGTPGAGVKALADNKTDVSIGYRNNQRSGVESTGSTNSVGNEFTAGGNVTRTATDKITDQATKIEAKTGSITQTAKTIEDQAVSDTAWNNKTETNKDYRAGIYVGLWAEEIAGGQAGVGGAGMNNGLSPTLDVSAGLRVYTFGQEKTKESKVEAAVTSSYKAGSNITSTSTEKTTLAGAQFNAGGAVTLNAGELDFKAAENKTTRTAFNQEWKEDARAGIVATVSPKDASVTAGFLGETVTTFDQMKITQTKSTAVVGSINAGSVNIQGTGAADKGDVRLTGTAITAAGPVTVASTNGDVILDAAKNTETKNGLGGNTVDKVRAKVALGVSAETGLAWEVAAGVEITTGHSKQDYEKVTNTGVNIKSTGGDVTLNAGKGVTTKGATVDAAGKATLTAQTGISLLEATDTESRTVSGHASFGAAGFSTTVDNPVSWSAAEGITGLQYGRTAADGKVSTITSGAGQTTTLTTAGGAITSQEAALGTNVSPNIAITSTARSNEEKLTAYGVDVNVVVATNPLASRISEAPRVVDQDLYEVKNRLKVDELQVSDIARVQTRAPLPAAGTTPAPAPVIAPVIAPTVPPAPAPVTPVVTAPVAPAPVPQGPVAAAPVNTAMPVFVPATALAPKTALVAPETREAPEARVKAPKAGTAPQVKVAVIKPVIKAPPAKVPPRAPRNPPRNKSLEADGAGQAATPATLTPVSVNQQAAPMTVSANAAPQ